MRKIMLALVLVLSACGVPQQTPAASNPLASGSQLSAAGAASPAPSASSSAAASGSDPAPFATLPLPAPSAAVSATPVDAYPAPLDFYPAPDATVGPSIITEATATPEDNPPGPVAASTTTATLTASVGRLFRNGTLDDVSFVDADYGWVLFDGTLYATRDGGASWQVRYVTYPEVPAGRPQQIDFVGRDRGVMVGYDAWRSESGLFVTSDGGATWTRLPVGERHDIIRWTDFLDERHGWVSVTAFPDPRRAPTPSLLRTNDGGATWTPIINPCPPVPHPYASAATNIVVEPSASPVPDADPLAKPPGAPAPLATGPAVPAPPELPAAGGSPPPDDVSVPLPSNSVGSPGPEPPRNNFGFSSFSFSSPTNGFILCAFGIEYPPQKQIFRTADGGQTWQETPLPPIELPYNPHIFFLDTARGWIGGENGMLAATTDGGQTWQLVPVPPDDRRGAVSHPRFLSPQAGYMVSVNTVVRTTDGGATWSEILPGPQPYGALHMFDAQRGIATAGQQIITTDDGGQQWDRVGVLPPACSRWDRSQLHFADATHGWLLGNIWQAINVPSTLCRTTDGGRTWTPLTVPPGVYTGIALMDANTGYLAGGAPNVQPLQRTRDGGATWETVASDQTIDGPIDFWTATDGWAVNDGQIVATADSGQTWALVPLGYHVRMFDVVPGGVVWALADDCALGMCLPVLLRSNDMGATWTRLRFETRAPSLQDRGYPSGYEPQRPNPPPTGDDMIWGIVDIAFNDDEHGSILLQDGRMWRITDGGQTWTELP